ncbi:MAG: DNA internalization-related competence protein ComEC/Rec2 [Firmicutes bacterium HGW-Firmicutes-14]|nr:MAG: DNA internalization-related competence protein ComEC/Rec2 [Firmicutes bacterium HGW-Firmicutes-14]
MSRPLVVALFAYISGIIIGRFCQPPVVITVLAGIAALLAGLYNAFRAWRKESIYFYIVIAVLGILMFQWEAVRDRGTIGCLAGKKIVLAGTVCREPDVRSYGVNYVVRVEEIIGGGFEDEPGEEPEEGSEKGPEDELKGRVLLTIYRPEAEYSYGDRLQIKGVPEKPGEPGNPGDFDYREYLEDKGIQLVIKDRYGAGIRKIGTGDKNPLLDFSIRFKQRLVSVIRATMPEPEAGLLEGVLFGSRGRIDRQSREDFALTGTVHVMSVSGYHAGLVAGLCLLMAELAGLGRPAVTILTAAVTGFYALMAGAGLPVVRAVVMIWVLLLARCLKRNYDWPSSLGLAALVILSFNPGALFSAGLQLSFAATWGIFYLAPLFRKPFSFCSGFAPGMAASVAAQAAVLPLAVYYFNFFSLISLPANLVIVPLISLAMLLGGTAALAGLLWLPPAELINITTGIIIRLALETARILSDLPYAAVSVRSPPVYLIACYYLLVIVIVEFFRNRRVNLTVRRFWTVNRRRLVLAALTVTAALIWTGIVYGGDNDLEVTFLDVGQGDAAVMEISGGYHIVIDTGGIQDGLPSGSGPGERVLVPFLRRKGINSIDLLLLSHPHADHIQGADALLKNFPVNMVVVSPLFDENPDGARLLKSFADEGSQIREISRGERVLFGENTYIEILSPAGDRVIGNGDYSENDGSLVIRFCYGDFRLLFTGDAEQGPLGELSRFPGSVEADIVKVPHHGSRNGWTESFYRAAGPRLAVISVGPNKFGHPSPEVLNGFSRLGIPVLRTDLNGAVIIKSNGRGYTTETVKGID